MKALRTLARTLGVSPEYRETGSKLRGVGDTTSAVRAEMGLGLVAAQANRPDEQAKAAAHLGDGDLAVARALDAIETLGSTYEAEQGSAQWALAEGFALQGNVPESNSAFGRAVEALDGGARFREAVQCCRRWAKLLREAGRDSEALDALERATDYEVRSHPASHMPLER